MSGTSFEREIITQIGSSPISQVVAYGSLVFVSGAVGRDPDNHQIAIGNVEEQTRQTLVNIQKRLDEAGTTFSKTLKVTVFLTNMDDFARMNSVYRTFFAEGFPARSCVQVTALPDKDALVEIELIAGR